MTVAAIVPSVQYAGNGSSVDFAAPFRFFKAEHLVVRSVSAAGVATTLMLGVDYTVAGGSTDGGGRVPMPTAPATGTMVEVDRVTPREQATDYLTNDTFPAETHEQALDRSIMVDQEQQSEIDRTLRVPIGEAGLVIPKLADWADGRVLGRDPVTGAAIAVPNSSAAVAADLVAAASAAADSETALAAVLVAQAVTEGYRDGAGAARDDALDAQANAEAARDVAFDLGNAPLYGALADLPTADGTQGWAIIPGGADEGVYEDTGSWTRQFDTQTVRAATEAARAEAAADTIDDLRASLRVAIQSIGMPDADIGTPATGIAGGTFTFGTPFAESGTGLRFVCECNTPGTFFLQTDVTRSGNDNTIVAETEITLVAGTNVIELPDTPYTAGHYWGLRTNSGRFLVDSGDGGAGGYYSAPGSLITQGNFYTDASLTTDMRVSVRLEALAQNVTGTRFETAETEIDALQETIGDDADTVQWIGGPEEDTPIDGSAIGSNTYVIADPIPQRMRLKRARAFMKAAGAVTLRLFDRADITMTQSGTDAELNFSGTGVVEITEFAEDIIAESGQFYGIAGASGKIAVASGVTPDGLGYYGGTGNVTTFDAATATRAYTISLALEWEPYTLSRRVNALEDGEASVVGLTHPTQGFILVWGLGESHQAGRAASYSSDIPEGRGYFYRRSDTSIQHLADPTNAQGTAHGSWHPAIGQALLDATHGAQGALIVNSGQGSTYAVPQGAPGPNSPDWESGAPWESAKADWDNAIAAAKAANIPINGVAIVICLGSNDAVAGTTKAVFKAALLDLIDRAKAYVDAGSDVPVLLVSTPPRGDASYGNEILAMQEAQAELVREQDRVFMATSAFKNALANGWLIDGIHAGQTGNKALGAAIGIAAGVRGAGLYPTGLE